MPNPPQKDKRHRLLLWSVGLFVLVAGTRAIAAPPGVDPDSCWGFLVMRNMEQGGAFNLLVSPDPANIAVNHTAFLAWWSPGQYLVPYCIKILFHVSTAHAVSITVVICYLIGLTGFYKFFKQLGFTQWVAAVSIAFMGTQQFFILQFVYYTGGELLLFTFMGWFLYGCFSFKVISWQALLFVFSAGLVGFFCKSSVLWMYLAGIICLWLNVGFNRIAGKQTKADDTLSLSQGSKTLWLWLKNGVLLAIPCICAVVCIYCFYLQKGANPSGTGGQFLFKPESFSFPLASPIVSGFSIDELVGGLIFQADGAGISYQLANIILVVLAVCSLAYVAIVAKFSPYRKYALALLVFYAVAVVFFSYLFLKQAAISFEARHFRIVGLLAIPGVVYLCFKTRVSRVIFFMVWAGFVYVGANFFLKEYTENKQTPKGATGFSQQMYDDAVLTELSKLDDAHHNDAIFVLASPDVAMEVTHNRTIIVPADDLSPQGIAKLRYVGFAGDLFMIMPTSYLTNGKGQGITRSFVNYHHFTVKQLSDDYYLYSAVN